MNTFFLRALGGLLLLATAISVTANAEYFDNAQSTQIKTSQPLNKSDRDTLLTKILTVFAEHYIDESSIDKVTASVRTQHNAGRYDDIESLDKFAQVVGNDFRRFANDLHLSLLVKNADEPMTHILKELPGRLTYNRASETVSYLYGNIGYLKFNKFHPADDAIRVADKAFLFLQNSDGLIIDMRDTVGGSPYLAQHMLSYFIETDTALWPVITRETKKSHTVKALNTPAHHRFREYYPVWILTSRQTASASELFAGVLQARGKATLVGEQTAGAGFYVGVRRITDRLVFRISLSKPVLAVTGANWEKTGLTPDITAERVDALDVAHQLANTK